MSDPRSIAVVAAAAALAALALVATLVAWGRVRGPWAIRTAQRTALLLGCQVAAVLLAFALVNHANGFYDSWDELVDPTPAVPVVSTGSPVATAPSSSARSAARSPSPQHAVFVPGQSGTQTGQATGALSGITGEIDVWTPPGYDPSRPGGYPVLLALGGHPGQPIDAISGLRLEAGVTAAVQSGTLRPSIVVAATTNIRGRDRGCADVPGGDQVATWLTQDVPALVASGFDVSTTDRWSVIGLSSGGYCAVRLALTDPTQFVAAVSIAGDNRPDAVDLRSASANDLRSMAKRGATPAVHVLAAASKQDADTANDALALQAAAGPGVGVDLETAERGGHNWAVWASMVPPALTWLGSHQS